jgi:amino acid permease
MYIGISFISVPKSVREAGIYGSIIGFIYVAVANIFSVYILLKARNRFKRIEIIDISDLSAVLYGNWSRPILATLLILANGLFLLAYVMFFGVQSDQLVCKTFKKRECGHEHEYSFIIVTILLPILWLRRLRNVAFFSIFILCFTFSAICLIVYINIKIYSKSPLEVENEYHIHITNEDRQYNYWDTSMIPIFCGTMMSLFEGNA